MQVKPDSRSRAYAPGKITDVVSRLKPTHAINRIVRLRDEWDDLAEVVGERGRTKVIRELIQWWLRWPGAKMPARPEVRDWDAIHAERDREEAERKAREAAE